MSKRQEISQDVLGEPSATQTDAGRRGKVAFGLSALALAGLTAAAAGGIMDLQSATEYTATTTCCISVPNVHT